MKHTMEYTIKYITTLHSYLYELMQAFFDLRALYNNILQDIRACKLILIYANKKYPMVFPKLFNTDRFMQVFYDLYALLKTLYSVFPKASNVVCSICIILFMFALISNNIFVIAELALLTFSGFGLMYIIFLNKNLYKTHAVLYI